MPVMRSSTIVRFAFPVALMTLIYVLSAQPDLSTGLGFWDLVLRKLAHAGIFGALTLLWFRALGPLTARALAVAATISFLYAITDEYHQSFVSGRHGSVLDVGIDAIGIGAAALLVRSRRFKWASAASRRWRVGRACPQNPADAGDSTTEPDDETRATYSKSR
jgi:VanZ family protein